MVNNSNEFAAVPPPPPPAAAAVAAAPATTTPANYFGSNAVEATTAAFRRRPSSLLHCMDQDGNIDAYRYIEYSRKRRIDFLNRANFICKMKCSLQKQHRSLSLPGTAVPSASATNGTLNGMLPSGNLGKAPINTLTNNIAFRKNVKKLSRFNVNLNPGAVATTTTPAETHRVMSRSSSLPLASTSS